MNAPEHALLMIGSAKGRKSTSEALGSHLLERLDERGLETDTARVHEALKKEDDRNALLEAVEEADLLLLACPLYVDSLPAHVTKLLELTAERRQDQRAPRSQRLVAILNCGFPEAFHNDTALAICQRFAHETGIEWAGGLALGGGETIAGRSLQNMGFLGFLARNPRKALDLAAAALAQGDVIPDEAATLMAKPLVPARLYEWAASRAWKKRAKKHGVAHTLDARPYQDGSAE